MKNRATDDPTVLLVDDEEEFRESISRALSRRGFVVQVAESGEQALELIRASLPQVVLLDLRMRGMDGISTLAEVRKIAPTLPVIILTGHGERADALSGIQLDIVDFLQKPVTVENLATRIRALLEAGDAEPLREQTIAELMVPVDSYCKVYEHDPLPTVVEAIRRTLSQPVLGRESERGHRTVLVFDGEEQFVGVIRLEDVIRQVVPPFLRTPYASFFTGMFLAELKVMGHRSAADLVAPPCSVERDAPLMEAAYLLSSQRLINLPVVDNGRLVGILRDKDVFLEMAASVLGRNPTAGAAGCRAPTNGGI